MEFPNAGIDAHWNADAVRRRLNASTDVETYTEIFSIELFLPHNSALRNRSDLFGQELIAKTSYFSVFKCSDRPSITMDSSTR